MAYRYYRAISLIEIMIAISIIVVAGGIVWVFQKNIFSLNGILQGNLLIEQEAGDTLKNFARETRIISPSSLGAYPIDDNGAQVNSFTFYSDIDNDGLKEKVRYFLTGTNLNKGIIKPSGNPLTYNPLNEVTTTVVHNVRNNATPIFNYYDENYDGTSAPLSTPVNILNIRLVKITLILDIDPLRIPEPFIFTTQISIRNLKNNL